MMAAKTDDSVLVELNHTNRTFFFIVLVLVLKRFTLNVFVLLELLVCSFLQVVFYFFGELD